MLAFKLLLPLIAIASPAFAYLGWGGTLPSQEILKSPRKAADNEN
jgi:hypothetical protein